MSQEKKSRDQAKRTDLSISSVNSSLTDEALEKEEKYRKTKKSLDMLKGAYKKLKEKHADLERQFEASRGNAKASDHTSDIGKAIGKDELAHLKEQAEKDAYKKTEKMISDLRKKIDDLDTENKVVSSQLKQACNESITASKENMTLRLEISDLKKEIDRISSERDAFRSRLKDVEVALAGANQKKTEFESDRDKLQVEVGLLKNKVIEGEYSAFCYTIKERGPGGHLQDLQLVLRKNCLGEPVFEFENLNGDIRVLSGALVSDVESDASDPFQFSIKYKQFGCFGAKTTETFSCEHRARLIWNIKNFLLRSKKDRLEAQRDSQASTHYQRNILNDLRKIFFA